MRRILLALMLAASVAGCATGPGNYVVSVPVADMVRVPSRDGEVVSQAVFGSEVVAVAHRWRWVNVRTADGYTGWVASADVRPVTRRGERRSATVSSLFAGVYREANIEKHHPLIVVPFDSILDVTGEQQNQEGRWVVVRLPDGRTGWVQAGDVAPNGRVLSIPETIALARRFLGLPYRWGGVSAAGFDCSGFTQLLLRHRGASAPRDSSVQAKWDGFLPVEKSDLQPGDHIFFGKTPGKVNHTGMYIGDGQFIHATRHLVPVVQIGRIDESPWRERYISARRLK